MRIQKVVIAALLAFVCTLFVGAFAQARGDAVRGKPFSKPNPKSTVIIDYVSNFENHKDGHDKGKPGGGGEDPPPPDPEPETHLDGHFELIGGIWLDADLSTPEVDPALEFLLDLRGFPAGSQTAIEDSFDAWDIETKGLLLASLAVVDHSVAIGDGFNSYAMRNLGGGGVLAATFITWDDANYNNNIDPGEEYLEMDVIHNSLIKWGTDAVTPKGKWYDLQGVATHEIGHVYGLTHPSGHAADTEQTMYASAGSKETKKRTLEPNGDILGIQSFGLGYGAR